MLISLFIYFIISVSIGTKTCKLIVMLLFLLILFLREVPSCFNILLCTCFLPKFRSTACSSWSTRLSLVEIWESQVGSSAILDQIYLLRIWNSWKPSFTSWASFCMCWTTQVIFCYSHSTHFLCPFAFLFVDIFICIYAPQYMLVFPEIIKPRATATLCCDVKCWCTYNFSFRSY